MDVENIEDKISETQTELSKFLEWSQTSIPICRSLDISNYGFMDESRRESKEKHFLKFLNNNGEPLSILEILDEKNNEISSLKKQIYNQKLQLKHYLNKNLLCEQVIINGSVVNIAMPEENDSINIAMTRFNKINNRKSRMIRVYDKINTTECRLFNLLRKQETILRKVTLDILSSHSEAINEPKTQEKAGMNYSVQLDLLSRLLTATVAIKRDINILKNYLKRLVAVEEERNALVDHIFRLPPEQRLNGHYLLSVERENAQLCTELENIRKDQIALKQKISQIYHEDEMLKETTRELKAKAVMPDFSDKLNDMIQVVEIETESLSIEMNEERERLTKEIENLTLAKHELEEKLSHYVDVEFKNENLLFKCHQLEGKCVEIENQISVLIEEKEDTEKIKYELATLQDNYNDAIKVIDDLKEKVKSLQKIEMEHFILLDIHEKLDDEHKIFKKQIEELENVKTLHELVLSRCPEPDLMLSNPNYFQVLYSHIKTKEEMEEKTIMQEDEIIRIKSAFRLEQMKNSELLRVIQRITNIQNMMPPYDTDFINRDKKISEKPIIPDEYGDRLKIFSSEGLDTARNDTIDINFSAETSDRHAILNNTALVCKDSEIAVVYHEAEKVLLTPPVTSKEGDSRDEKICRMCVSVPQDLGSEINSLCKSENKLFGAFEKIDDKFNTTKDALCGNNSNNRSKNDTNESEQDPKGKNDTLKEISKENRHSANKENQVRGSNKNNSKLPVRNTKQKELDEKISPDEDTPRCISESLYTHPTLSTVTILNDTEKIEPKKQLIKASAISNPIPLEIVNGMSVTGITDSIVINPYQALNDLPQIPLNDMTGNKLDYQTDSNIIKNEQHIRTKDLYPSKGCCPKCELNKEKKNNENKKNQPLQPKLVEHKPHMEVKVPQIIIEKPQDYSTVVKEVEKVIVGKEKLKNIKNFKDNLCMYPDVGLEHLNFD